MIRYGRTSLILSLALVTYASLTTQAAPQLAPDQTSAIEALVRKSTETQGIPGLSVAVAVDDQLVYSHGFGLADVENKVPATAQTVYRTASIAKTLTAVAVMQLAEKGRIDFDQPLDQYFVAYPKKKWPITARQLLGHLAGVRHYKTPAETLMTKHFFDVTSSLQVFADDPLLFRPGTEVSLFDLRLQRYSALWSSRRPARTTPTTCRMRSADRPT